MTPAPNRMPDHVVAHLVATGVLTPDGTTRRATPRPCPRCRRLVIVGLDDDRCAMTATVDPQPLTPAGELSALLTGRPTYTLTPQRNAYTLNRRDQFAIAAKPAGTLRNADVVAAHECGAPELDAAPTRIPPPMKQRTNTDCPF